MNKLISVIIPVKEGEKYILESIKGIKKQNMNTEIIIVDDKSDDNSSKIAEKEGCTIIYHETNRGPIAARNTGLSVSSGKYIMFLDQDDIMTEGSLKIMSDYLDNTPDASAVMAKVEDFVSPEMDNTELNNKDPYYGIFSGSVLIRKSFFDITGEFDENYRTGEMLFFQSKLKEHNLRLDKIDIVSCKKRIHDNNFGKLGRDQKIEDYMKLLRKRI